MSDTTQGELKRRLEQLKEETETDSILSGMLTLSRRDIDALLDEAMAEFPDENDSKYDYSSMPLREFADDVKAWRDKWLGKGAP